MNCPKCHNTTFISIEENGETVAYPCDCRKEKEARINLETKLIGAYIPRIFWGYTLDQYINLSEKFLKPPIKLHNDLNIDTIKKYISNPHSIFDDKIQVVWIWGSEENSCHTTLAVILGTAFIKEGLSVRFISMQDLLNAFTDFSKEKISFQEFDTHKIYVIDDMFDTTRCIAKGDYTKINLYNWLNNAVNNGKIFICTSNTPIEKIDKDYLQSRIVLSRSYKQLEIRGSFSSPLASGELKK